MLDAHMNIDPLSVDVPQDTSLHPPPDTFHVQVTFIPEFLEDNGLVGVVAEEVVKEVVCAVVLCCVVP
jgi:hypothetical protein